jgi:hypothetical protein
VASHPRARRDHPHRVAGQAPVHARELFDVWGQPLGPSQVGPAHGPVTAFYNGQHYTGNPNDIPIGKRVQIQLDVGRPLVAPEQIGFPSGL